MKSREIRASGKLIASAAAALSLLAVQPAVAAGQPAPVAASPLTYADIVDLADSSTMVVKARIRKQSTLAPVQSPGLRPGTVRLLVEADTEALISGRSAIGESLRYLVDVPLDAKGKAPKLKKQSFLIFAFPVPGVPRDLQLIDVDSQFPTDPALEARIRDVLMQLASPDAPPIVTGVGEALAVEGNLSGESETQVFLVTKNDAPVSLNVVRRPNMEPEWGVSWTELVDQSAQPPQEGSLEWYRLACFLPPELSYDSILSRDGQSRALAAADYRYVLDQLGHCSRTRGGPPKFPNAN
ncbi:hypothetical protein [Altererythrobacter fulvus]|uniref:hypothetical protein n=1 Tax=Caenibius fulvus TaxID=2126012 RepID=UPI003018FB84